jgi:penicillin-binding protein 1A
MKQAVARRPIEQFEIEVKMPDWQIEGGEEAWEGEPDDFLMVDPDGNPIAADRVPAAPQPAREPQAEPDPAANEEEAPRDQLNQEWLDRVTGRAPPTREPPPRRPPPPPPTRSEPPEPLN